MPRTRCAWAASAARYFAYHDREWGRPVRRDRGLYEMLVLGGAQAGLSWLTILLRRERYREAFCGFDLRAVARFTARDLARFLRDPGLIRNRAKLAAAIGNAKVLLAIRDEHGSFSRFCWRFVGGRPRANLWRSSREVPTETEESRDLSRELSRRGMRFVGPTICYAFMQTVGLVNDHTTDCFRHAEIADSRDR